MNILEALKRISDPRKRQGRQCPLYGLLAILLLIAMRGESSLRRMRVWSCQRQQELLLYPALACEGQAHSWANRYGTL